MGNTSQRDAGDKLTLKYTNFSGSNKEQTTVFSLHKSIISMSETLTNRFPNCPLFFVSLFFLWYWVFFFPFSPHIKRMLTTVALPTKKH